MNDTVKKTGLWADILTNTLFAVVLFGAGFLVGRSNTILPYVMGTASGTPAEAREDFIAFWEVWDLVNQRYYEQPLDQQQLVEGAIVGMLDSLDDDYSIYLSPREQTMASDVFEGEFEGIGAEVIDEDGAIVIVSPYEGAPASDAGLRPRDIIRMVDGIDIAGMDIGEVVSMVRGPAGTDVVLTIERDGESFDVTITRGVIDLPSVSGDMLTEIDPDIAYIRIRRFDLQSAEELQRELDKLIPNNPEGIVLDLRRNPGGALTAVVDIADQFLPEGVALIEEFGDGSQALFETTDEGLAETVPMVVLVDGGSASASEVLAGAIQDYGRGVLIGETTFGKGTVQTWENLSNGGGIRLTIARWLTPEESWIHERGIAPDIEVIISEDEFLENGEDVQLKAAVEHLSNQ